MNKIGEYEILGKLGEGGMGEVYRARDPRLRRDVALKILPALFSTDPERLARFEREAQALAALNHPHIAAIYGFEEFNGTPVLIMELVEGATLAERIQQGPVSAAETIGYARQMATALDAAHEKGIIHRDLKPANIKVTDAGEIKILDFGLAKAVAPTDAGATTGLANSPTLTARATQLGVILGTGAYMSPEQARGKAVDKRADIWGFGCVLFELLTAKRAFEGEEITDVLARVIERDPDWSQLPASTPPALRKLLERCLAKDPKARLRDIGEARHFLDDASTPAAAPSVSAATPRQPAAGRLLPWTVAALAVIAASVMWFQRPRAVPDQRQLRVELAIPADVEFFSGPRVSADGNVVAFVGNREGVRQVYIRRLDRGETRAVPGTENAQYVDVGTDGRTGVLISTDTRLKRIAFDTDLIESVLTGADILGGAAIAPDGTIVFVQGLNLMALPPGSTTARVIAAADPKNGDVALSFPRISQSGRNVLYSVRGAGLRLKIAMVPLAGGTPRLVTEIADYVHGAAGGKLVTSQSGVLLVSTFDEDSGKFGTPTRIQEDVFVSGSGVGAVAASVTTTGTIVLAGTRLATSRLVWVDSEGTEVRLIGPPRIYQNPRVSPDGRQIAFAASGNIWNLDPVRGGVTRVSPEENDATIGFPAWSSDGRRVFYRSRGGIAEQQADGEGKPRLLKGTTTADYPSSVTADGKTVIFLRITAETSGDILSVPVEGGEVRTIVKTPAYEGAPQVSPDDKWIAYVSNHSGQMDVYLRALAGGDRRWPVSSGGGLHPLWSRDGKQIYYRIGQKLMAVDVTTSPEVRLGAPRLILERQYEFGVNLTFPNYSLSRDGRQFLMVRRDAAASHLNYVTNWLK